MNAESRPWPHEWTAVLSDRSASGVLAVRVEHVPDGGFLLHTREAHGEFDCWFATEEQLRDALGDYVLATEARLKLIQDVEAARDRELRSPGSQSSLLQSQVPERLRPVYALGADMFAILVLDSTGTFRALPHQGIELRLTARGWMSAFELLAEQNAALAHALKAATRDFDHIRAKAESERASLGPLCERPEEAPY